MNDKQKKVLFWSIKLFLFLRVSLLIFGWLGVKFLSFKPRFPYAEAVLMPFGSQLFWGWANFDGVHYLMIAEHGYVFGLTQAFFPVLPLLIRWLNVLLNNRLLAGLLISHLSFIGLLYIFYQLGRLDFAESLVKKALVFLVVFPTSFYFLSLYTESLFLALVLASFYLARKKQWFKAGLLVGVASGVKLMGVLMVPALAYEYWQNREEEAWPALVACLLPALGLGAYMFFLKQRFGDPLLFVHSQPGFGAGRSVDKIVLLYQVFWRYLKMVFTVDPHNPIYFTIWLEAGISGLFLGLLAYGFKKIRKSYLVFASLAYLLPTLTGTLSSMPRYVLVLFPAFLVLGGINKTKLVWGLAIVSYIFLGLCTALFISGRWVA